MGVYLFDGKKGERKLRPETRWRTGRIEKIFFLNWRG